MTSRFSRKTVSGAFAALAMGAAVIASSTPASAGGWYPAYGWGIAAGVAGGLAAGALAAQASRPYYYGPGYAPAYYPAYGCYTVRQRVLTDYGWRTVRRRVCD